MDIILHITPLNYDEEEIVLDDLHTLLAKKDESSPLRFVEKYEVKDHGEIPQKSTTINEG
jgi:hypothetical protein